jgi:hypothetical protein
LTGLVQLPVSGGISVWRVQDRTIEELVGHCQPFVHARTDRSTMESVPPTGDGVPLSRYQRRWFGAIRTGRIRSVRNSLARPRSAARDWFLDNWTSPPGRARLPQPLRDVSPRAAARRAVPSADPPTDAVRPAPRAWAEESSLLTAGIVLYILSIELCRSGGIATPAAGSSARHLRSGGPPTPEVA